MSGVDIRPDPRLSNLRPAWLPDTDWRDRLTAMADDDVDWIETQWQLAGGGTAQVDTSWVTFTTETGDSMLPWLVLSVLMGTLAGAAVLLAVLAVVL